MIIHYFLSFVKGFPQNGMHIFKVFSANAKKERTFFKKSSVFPFTNG